MSDENMKKIRPVKKYVFVVWSAGDVLRGTKCTRPTKENDKMPSTKNTVSVYPEARTRSSYRRTTTGTPPARIGSDIHQQ